MKNRYRLEWSYKDSGEVKRRWTHFDTKAEAAAQLKTLQSYPWIDQARVIKNDKR